MKVDIALFAYLADHQPDGVGGRHARTFDLPEGTTIADMIATLRLPDQPESGGVKVLEVRPEESEGVRLEDCLLYTSPSPRD